MKLKLLLFCLFTITTSVCAKTLDYWKTECVGRLQLNLPGNADQAALSVNGIRNKTLPPDNLSFYPYAFPDNEKAEWTSFSYDALLDISHPMTPIDKKNTLKLFEVSKVNAKKNVQKDANEFLDLSLGTHEGVAWKTSNFGLNAKFFVSDVALLWRASVENQAQLDAKEAEYQAIIANLRQRPIFDIPHEPGVCLPYLFIRDSNQIEHGIAMTYRLSEHPDITINLVSRTARPTPAKGDKPENVTNEYNIGDYWAQRMMSVHQFVTLWHRPRSMRAVHLAGQDGLASFVAVIRKKGNDPDVIYRAVARGNPEAPEAAPDIELVVEQERGNAIKRDIKPLTEDEVLNLAKQIAASVAVRPVR